MRFLHTPARLCHSTRILTFIWTVFEAEVVFRSLKKIQAEDIPVQSKVLAVLEDGVSSLVYERTDPWVEYPYSYWKIHLSAKFEGPFTKPARPVAGAD